MGGFEAVKWIIGFYTNRKTNARIEDAHDSFFIFILLH